MLASWYRKEEVTINLAQNTSPIDLKDSEWFTSCYRNLYLERHDAQKTHLFRTEDLLKLGTYTIRIVDAAKQELLIKTYDPTAAILEGKPVDHSVDDAIRHSIITLSEIRFDKSHTHALVSISSQCGMVCGHSTPLLLVKVNGKWRVKSQCGGHIS